jgi:DNA-binding response OmpR family regulator
LERIWNGLTQEQKLALSEAQKLPARRGASRADNTQADGSRIGHPQGAPLSLAEQQQAVLSRLEAKGLCQRTGSSWRIIGELLSSYIAGIEGRVRGKIWLDEQSRVIYQGQEAVEELTGLQYEILGFLIKNPRIRHTRDDIIDNVWPDEEQREGITPNALQVHIASIRKKIETNPASPRYLITWHGRPGGYQFFPEGKPE